MLEQITARLVQIMMHKKCISLEIGPIKARLKSVHLINKPSSKHIFATHQTKLKLSTVGSFRSFMLIRFVYYP